MNKIRFEKYLDEIEELYEDMYEEFAYFIDNPSKESRISFINSSIKLTKRMTIIRQKVKDLIIK